MDSSWAVTDPCLYGVVVSETDDGSVGEQAYSLSA
jgi:hypothetical protein